MKSPVTIITILLILLAASLGYIVGKQGFVINNPLESIIPSPVPSLLPSPLPVLTASPTPKSSQIIEAGGILNFPKYKLTIPSDWTFTKESVTKDDQKLTLSKGVYKIIIQQGGFGGAMCLYPGDAGSEGPSGRYTSYVEIQTQSGDLLRRSTPENGKGYGICELSKYGWGAPTKYGHIGLTVLENPAAEELQVIDTILGSLTHL